MFAAVGVEAVVGVPPGRTPPSKSRQEEVKDEEDEEDEDDEEEDEEVLLPLPPLSLGRTEAAWAAPRARRVELREFLPLCLVGPSPLDLPDLGFGPVFA